MAEISIAIIGAGPRALNIIECLAWRLTNEASLPDVRVHLIDPGQPCEGVHTTTQSSHLLTNTLASQVTMFSPANPLDPNTAVSGPSFTEWARSEGYRRFGAAYRRCATGGEEISDLDYLPRAMLGQYLRSAFEIILRRAPGRLRAVHHKELAVDASDDPCCVYLESGSRIKCDALILATGHCELQPAPDDLQRQSFVALNRSRNPRLGYFGNPYPTSRLNLISSAATVLVQGLGLTAYDVVTDLTSGRGGAFVDDQDGLRYVRSGEEPRILLFSRQSLPYSARGINQKGVDGGHTARFLTKEAVDSLRARIRSGNGTGRIDFRTEIVPLIRKEMAFAYRCAAERRPVDPDNFQATPVEEAIVDRILEPNELLNCHGLPEFRSKIIEYLRNDLKEAQRGNLGSPLKAATDSIRDLRAGLSAAIEFGGLLPDSHRYVVEHFVPLTNRITFGPPLRRNAELLALIKSGIVDWAGGPVARLHMDSNIGRFVVKTPFKFGTESTAGDVLVVARVFGHRPLEDKRPLSRNMVSRGIARPFYNGDYHPHGLDVEQRMRLVRADGSPNHRIWGIGFVTEGARFHTHALPRPRRRSTQLSDAAALVDDLFESLEVRSTTTVQPNQNHFLVEEQVQ